LPGCAKKARVDVSRHSRRGKREKIFVHEKENEEEPVQSKAIEGAENEMTFKRGSSKIG